MNPNNSVIKNKQSTKNCALTPTHMHLTPKGIEQITAGDIKDIEETKRHKKIRPRLPRSRQNLKNRSNGTTLCMCMDNLKRDYTIPYGKES
jgi:hypothetical protein